MLKEDIGINAEAIWQLLSDKRMLSIEEIVELTDYKESMILLALGWLSSEDKVRFTEDEGETKVELNNFISETFF